MNIIISKSVATSLVSLENRIVLSAGAGKDLERQAQLVYGKCESLVADYLKALVAPYAKAIDKASTPDALRSAKHAWFESYHAHMKPLGEKYIAARGCKENAWTTVVSRAKSTLKAAGVTLPKIESQDPQAIAKRAERGANTKPKAETKEVKVSVKKADVTPYDIKMSASDIKREIADSMSNLFDTIQGHIPEGKRNSYIEIQTHFITTVGKLLGK